METTVKKLYEAMFLIDPAKATDWDAVVSTLESVLKRADGEIVSMKKWGERKLAYEINGKTKGTYILCYFRGNGERIQDIEKAVQLSEQVMRVLILSAEGRSQKDIEKETPAERMEKEMQKDSQETNEKVGAGQASSQ